MHSYLEQVMNSTFDHHDTPVDPEISKLEPRMRKEMEDSEVLAKKDSAVRWCQHATEHATRNGGKPWKYLLIPQDAIAENMSLAGLAAQFAAAIRHAGQLVAVRIGRDGRRHAPPLHTLRGNCQSRAHLCRVRRFAMPKRRVMRAAWASPIHRRCR